jgi:hypothetical protein
MINVNDLKIFIDFIANKEQSGTAYSIPQLNNAFQAANIDLFKLRYGLPEDYVPGQPIPKMGYENTQKIKDDLRAFKEKISIPVDEYGIMLLPSDYVHKTGIEYLKIINKDCCGGPPSVFPKEVEIIDDDKWSERLGNTIKKPTLDYPVCNFLKDSIRFEPKNLRTVEFSYLRVPVKPIWGYTFVNNVAVYDAATSTNVEWNEILFTDFAKLVLNYFSINLKDAELKQAMSEYKVRGV